jgi:hypothetical protein
MKRLEQCVVVLVVAIVGSRPAMAGSCSPSPTPEQQRFNLVSETTADANADNSSQRVLPFVVTVATLRAEQNAGKLTARELRVLAVSARTPQEHLRLADYYSAKGEADLAQAMQQEKMALNYSANTVASSSKFVFGTVNHCVSLVQRLKRHAAKMRTLAWEHEQMAKEAGSK